MEEKTLGQVPGATNRYVILDSERENGATLEGKLLVRVPKNAKPGQNLEVVFQFEEVWPLDPTWNGEGEHPAKIRARHDEELRDELGLDETPESVED
jgi:hypothetical protein